MLLVFANPVSTGVEDACQDKGDKACVLGDLSNWLADEKDWIDFVIGAVFLGLAAIIITITRLLVNYPQS